MTIQTYFPTSNPATSSSDPNAQSAEGYYWIGNQWGQSLKSMGSVSIDS